LNKHYFDNKKGLIIVRVRIKGPLKEYEGFFALDTGATTTLINSQILEAIGYTDINVIDKITFTTGSGKEKAKIIKVQSIIALGITKTNFKVISHQLPLTTYVDGLLGIDFLKGKKLTLDFVKGEIIV
jgi:predicted aspartyl protease